MKLITTFSGLFAVLAVAIGVYFIFQNKKPSMQTLEQDGFQIVLTYAGSSEWKYELTGTLPNPCYSIDLLADSSNLSNGKTNILLYINPPLPDELCTQKIQSITKSETLQASDDAIFELIIVENESTLPTDSNINPIPQYDFDSAQTITNEDYKFKVVYDQANKMWGYIVSGTLPNECYSANVNILIAESFPEQITATLEVTSPNPETICTQVIQDLQLTGEFSASDEASIKFEVETN